MQLSGSRQQSSFEALARLSESERKAFVANLTAAEAEALQHEWRFWARPKQLPPHGDWRIWLTLAGRGFGKSWLGSNWVNEQVREHGKRHIALLGATEADARDVMVDGPSGIIQCSPPGWIPKWNPSARKLTWPNGAVGHTFSAEKPDQLRGPQFDCAWVDELAKFRYPEAWDQLMMGLRLGTDPRVAVTTTPRPTPLIKGLLHDPTVRVVRGSTYENRANLAPGFFSDITRKYEGTRLGRQELNAEILDDAPGALWHRDTIDADRRTKVPELQRVVVAIDPSVSSESDAAATGIVVAGLGVDGEGYLLADGSLQKPTPEQWGRQAVVLYHQHNADRIIGEINNGGDLVEANIRSINPDVPFKAVRASRGKAVRAEPVAALSEQHRIHHVGSFPELEDELCEFEAGLSTWSPNRLDAYVWAFTSLMLGGGRATYDPKYSAYLPSLRI